MDFPVIIQQDSEGWYIGSVPTLPGCHTQAKSLPELYQRLEEVIQLCLESESVETETRFVGVQNLRVPANA